MPVKVEVPGVPVGKGRQNCEKGKRLERRIGEVVIYEENYVDVIAVFSGFLGSPTFIPTSFFDWNCEEYEVDVFKSLTLKEIWEQYRKKAPDSAPFLTVVVESPLSGAIYQCGNHGEGVWEQIGTLRGYA